MDIPASSFHKAPGPSQRPWPLSGAVAWPWGTSLCSRGWDTKQGHGHCSLPHSPVKWEPPHIRPSPVSGEHPHWKWVSTFLLRHQKPSPAPAVVVLWSNTSPGRRQLFASQQSGQSKGKWEHSLPLPPPRSWEVTKQHHPNSAERIRDRG